MGKPIRFQAGGNDFTPLPEGVYDVKFLSVELTTSSNNNPQLALKAEVLDGPMRSRQPMIWYSCTPKAGWKLRKLLEELGVPYQDEGQDAEGLTILAFDADDLVGRCVRYDVVQREYQGKKNNNFNNETVSTFDPHFEELQAEAAGTDPAGPSEPVKEEAPSAPQQAAAPSGNAARRRPQPAVRPR